MSSNTITQNPIFAPTQVPGCSLWLDGADSSTVIYTGASVTQWNDKSGNSRNATLFNSNSPTYSSNGMNFTGIQALSTSLTASSTTESGFVICKFTNFSANSTLLGSINGQGGRQFRVGSNAIIETIKQDIVGVLYTGATLSSNTTYLLEYVNNGTTLTHFSNASTYASGSSIAYTAGLTTGIGGRLQAGGGLQEALTGVINEIVVFSIEVSTTQRQLVEGYLAWKWGLTGNLPSNHPYKNTPVYSTSVLPASIRPSIPTSLAPSSSPFVFGFSPSQITSLATWLDATDTSTLYSDSNGSTLITGNGSSVRYWRDKSTNANNMRVSAAPAAPTFQTGSFNGLPALSFNTAYFNAVTLSKVSAQTNSVFVFYRTLPGNTAPIVYGVSPGNNEIGMYPTYYFVRHGNGTDNGVGPTDTNQPTIGEILSSDSSLLYFNNFTNISPVSPVLGTPGNIFYSTYFNVGTYQSGVGYNPQFSIGEVIIYNKFLSTTERQQVEGYMAWKWGLSANLPSNHPYKNSPPGLSIAVPPRLTMSSRLFSPLSFSGCTLWLDGTDPNGNGNIPSIGSTIATWVDKSSSGINFTGTNVTYSYDSVYKVNAPTFNGSSSIFNQVNTGLYPLNNVSTYSIFSVARRLTTNLYHTIYFATGSGNLLTYRFTNANVSEWYLGQAADVYLNNNSTNGDGINELLTLVPGTATGYINGNRIGSNTTATSSSQLYFILGYQFPLYLNGYIYELIVYNTAVSTNQRQSIEGYLAWKYSLQGSLPSNHPYKRWPPPS